MHRNTLFYGDNLDVMREFIPDESVDLVYLDPPFNSARDYNVLFKQAKRDENQAQITAFTDTCECVPFLPSFRKRMVGRQNRWRLRLNSDLFGDALNNGASVFKRQLRPAGIEISTVLKNLVTGEVLDLGKVNG